MLWKSDSPVSIANSQSNRKINKKVTMNCYREAAYLQYFVDDNIKNELFTYRLWNI